MTVEELIARKKKLKLTTNELSGLAALPYGTVSKILTRETKNPSHITMEKLEEALTREEVARRFEAYREAMVTYFAEHPEMHQDQKRFEQIYRAENHLTDDPILYANRVGEEPVVYGSAVRKDSRVTVRDMELSPEGRGKELIDGTIITGEMPGLVHQDMVKQIWRQIDSYISKNGGKCKAYDQGVNVYLDEDDYTLVIPDILVICDSNKIQDRGIYGAPDWVIEVVSPSTREMDYHKKLHKYMAAGVQEYWIVDMEREIVSVCINGEPMSVTVYHFAEEVPVELYGRKLTISFA